MALNTIACVAIVSFPSAREVNKTLESHAKAYDTKVICHV